MSPTAPRMEAGTASTAEARAIGWLGRLGYWRAFVRWLVPMIFWTLFVLPGLLDGLSPLWDGERRAWHDKAVGSVVVEL